MRTIDIVAKECFGKIGTYQSARIIIDLDTPEQETIYVPTMHASGDDYVTSALFTLHRLGKTPDDYNLLTGSVDGLIMRHCVLENRSREDVDAWGKNRERVV